MREHLSPEDQYDDGWADGYAHASERADFSPIRDHVEYLRGYRAGREDHARGCEQIHHELQHAVRTLAHLFTAFNRSLAQGRTAGSLIAALSALENSIAVVKHGLAQHGRLDFLRFGTDLADGSADFAGDVPGEPHPG